MDKPQQPFSDGMPNLSQAHFEMPTAERVEARTPLSHAPRFLILYGSLRERSFSRFLAYEAARLLEAMGGEVRIFHAHGLPLPDDAAAGVQSQAEQSHGQPHSLSLTLPPLATLILIREG